MKKTYREMSTGDLKRYEVRIESDMCPVGDPSYHHNRLGLLRTLTDTQGLLDCGPYPFQTLKMTHDGNCWVVTLEATGA